MPSIWWVLLGVVLGWCVGLLNRKTEEFRLDDKIKRASEGSKFDISLSAFWTELLTCLIGWLKRLVDRTSNDESGHLANSLKTSNLGSDPRRKSLLRIACAFVVMAAFVFAIDDEINSSWVYEIEAILFRPKVSGLFIGFCVGLWATEYRDAIASRAAELYQTVLGGGDHSPWALQAGVAILILVAILAAARPDLIGRVESIKAGELEAKFNAVPATTASALEAIQFSINDFYRGNALDNWSHFADGYANPRATPDQISSLDSCADISPDFVSPNLSPDRSVTRWNVLALINDQKPGFHSQRLQITCVLFRFYFEPLVDAVSCLQHHGELENIRRMPDFLHPTFLLRDLLLRQVDEIPEKERVAEILRDCFENRLTGIPPEADL